MQRIQFILNTKGAQFPFFAWIHNYPSLGDQNHPSNLTQKFAPFRPEKIEAILRLDMEETKKLTHTRIYFMLFNIGNMFIYFLYNFKLICFALLI